MIIIFLVRLYHQEANLYFLYTLEFKYTNVLFIIIIISVHYYGVGL